MRRYKCSKCHRVLCGWAVRYKLKYKCPDCGGELEEVYDDNWEFRRDPFAKVLKTRKNLRSGNL
ncbi:hypothetical protein ES695_21460 [Candidatus Atribacteria bacterium 1244-E10-H5-B2]|nr:MAG: hypothetical protein ES695_21460 [Candidatus Atribacteria bacterium 1244-E10-H5-B2]